jgi:mono/diheme cytochrome c family protein
MKTGPGPRLKQICLAALLAVTLAPSLRAQQQSVAPSAHEQEEQEDPRGLRTREFLGLGRMPDKKKAAAGATLFGSNCGFCHGVNARGASAPDLLRSAVVLDDNEGELIGATVHNGRPGKGMPAFPSFSNDDLRDIAEFLHLQVELAANRGTYQALNVVTGNAQAGATYFNGAGKCNTCHSPTGDLAHIGSKMKAPDLQQTFLYPGGRNRTPSPVTVTLPNGKQMTGTLKHLDDFYVAFDDADGKYHSIPIEKGLEVHLEREEKLLFHRQMLARYTNQQMHDLTAYLVTLK